MMTYREFLRLCNPVTAGRAEASRVSAGVSFPDEILNEQQWAAKLQNAAQQCQDCLN